MARWCIKNVALRGVSGTVPDNRVDSHDFSFFTHEEAETFINMEMPSSLSVELMQTKGARQAYDFSTKVGFKTELFDNRTTVTDTQANELFQIRWKGRSAKAGSSETFIDSGKNIEFVPKDKGFAPSALVSVWADISIYEKHAVLTDDAGNIITDDNGAIIIIPTYE